jgi:hypothetical protein
MAYRHGRNARAPGDRYLYGFFMPSRGRICTLFRKETPMDLWFVGLIVVLAVLTWGGIVLCERLLGRP